MPVYYVWSHSARKRGAIGLFYRVSAEINAPTRDEAIASFTERYEAHGVGAVEQDWPAREERKQRP